MPKGGGKGGGGGSGKKAPLAPAFRASQYGDLEALSEALDGDAAALESRNADGWTPLIAAAFHGQLAALELLLGRGADAGAACRDGDTPMHYASAQGHADVLRRLALCERASFTSADADGETPEDVASSGKIRKLLQQLAADREAGRGRGGGAGTGAGVGVEEEDDDDDDDDDDEDDDDDGDDGDDGDVDGGAGGAAGGGGASASSATAR